MTPGSRERQGNEFHEDPFDVDVDATIVLGSRATRLPSFMQDEDDKDIDEDDKDDKGVEEDDEDVGEDDEDVEEDDEDDNLVRI